MTSSPPQLTYSNKKTWIILMLASNKFQKNVFSAFSRIFPIKVSFFHIESTPIPHNFVHHPTT